MSAPDKTNPYAAPQTSLVGPAESVVFKIRPPVWHALRWIPAVLCFAFSMAPLLMGLIVLGSVVTGLGSLGTDNQRSVSMLIWHAEISLGLVISAGVGIWAGRLWLIKRWLVALGLTLLSYIAVVLFFESFSPR